MALVLLNYMASAAPMPRINKYCFQPTGKAFHYYYFGDECFDDYRLDNISNNSGAIVPRLSADINSDGFERRRVTVYGKDRITNIRYGIDEDNFDEFPTENKYAPFILNFDGQVKNTIVDNDKKVITLYYPDNKATINIKCDFTFTDYGFAMYRAFTGISGTVNTSTSGMLVSNKISNLDEIYNNANGVENRDQRLKAHDKCNKIIDEILKEKIDYSKETYLYVITGQFVMHAYKWNVTLVKTNEKSRVEDIKVVPSKTTFDKRKLYSSNIIFNLFGNEDLPVKIYCNGNEVPQQDNFIFDYNYLVVSKAFLNSFQSGETLNFTAEFNNGKEANMSIEIIDSTNLHYVKKFDDVTTESEYWEFINSLYDRKIIKGNGTGIFISKSFVTKAELYAMLARSLGYEEKERNNWYDWAVEAIQKYDNNKNDVNEQVSYNEAAKLLIRVLYNNINYKQVFNNLSIYDSYMVDGKIIFVTSYDAITNDGINIEHESFLFALPMVDVDKAFQNVPMTREEAVKAIYRFINLMELMNTQGLIENH